VITSLAYIGFTSPAAAEWEAFGAEIIGAQVSVADDGAVGLRLDQYAPRVTVHPGDRNGVAYLGWDCLDAEGLKAAVERVSDAGFAVVQDEAASTLRQVAALWTFDDPWGFRHELTTGFRQVGPFAPGRPMDGFVTGELGVGHAVLVVPDLESGMRFYMDVLGFKLSDHVEAGASLRFLHCNPRHHTVALVAIPGLVGIHHLMIEVNNSDDVGTALDRVNERQMPLAMTLGRHTNDLMTSFYVRTPSGFELEYGSGGRQVDDTTWTVEVYDSTSIWGHKQPAQPLRPGAIRPLAQSA
jgi:extradiol dioxygenase